MTKYETIIKQLKTKIDSLSFAKLMEPNDLDTDSKVVEKHQEILNKGTIILEKYQKLNTVIPLAEIMNTNEELKQLIGIQLLFLKRINQLQMQK